MNPVDARHLLDAAEREGYKPNAWEKKFIKNTRKNWIDQGKFLKKKHGEKVQSIYRKSQGQRG